MCTHPVMGFIKFRLSAPLVWSSRNRKSNNGVFYLPEEPPAVSDHLFSDKDHCDQAAKIHLHSIPQISQNLLAVIGTLSPPQSGQR